MNAMEKLAREIVRVTELREEYRRLDGMPGVNVQPVIAIMTASLEAACLAASDNDITPVIHALKDLEGFTE